MHNLHLTHFCQLFRCQHFNLLYTVYCCFIYILKCWLESLTVGFSVVWCCSWLEGYGSPPRGHNGTIDSHGRLTFSVGDPKQLVREQLPDLLRLSTDCPFEDVRERCASILLDLEVWILRATSPSIGVNCNWSLAGCVSKILPVF